MMCENKPKQGDKIKYKNKIYEWSHITINKKIMLWTHPDNNGIQSGFEVDLKDIEIIKK